MRNPERKSISTLRRYTNLPALIHILTEKRLTMLSPNKWDDRTDAYFLERYKEKKVINTLLALCFSEAMQTYSHWRVFAHGTDGVCIDFDKQKLLSYTKADARFTCRKVEYKILSNIKDNKIAFSRLPFLKRNPYKSEQEFRILFEDSEMLEETFDFEISLDCIKKITVNPWLPRSLFSSVRQNLKRIDGCKKIPVLRSQIIENAVWRNVADKST